MDIGEVRVKQRQYRGEAVDSVLARSLTSQYQFHRWLRPRNSNLASSRTISPTSNCESEMERDAARAIIFCCWGGGIEVGSVRTADTNDDAARIEAGTYRE